MSFHLCLSYAMNFDVTALAATGFIWVRYSLVITPVNYSLAAVSLFLPIPPMSSDQSLTTFMLQVNFFVGSTGLGQLARIVKYVSPLPVYSVDPADSNM